MAEAERGRSGRRPSHLLAHGSRLEFCAPALRSLLQKLFRLPSPSLWSGQQSFLKRSSCHFQAVLSHTSPPLAHPGILRSGPGSNPFPYYHEHVTPYLLEPAPRPPVPDDRPLFTDEENKVQRSITFQRYELRYFDSRIHVLNHYIYYFPKWKKSSWSHS